MLYIQFGLSSAKKQFIWYVGEPMPPQEVIADRVISFQADGDELDIFFDAMKKYSSDTWSQERIEQSPLRDVTEYFRRKNNKIGLIKELRRRFPLVEFGLWEAKMMADGMFANIDLLLEMRKR